jgi:hypothetical protein
MERSDNPSKTVTYALIFGGLTAAAAAAYFLTRTKRTPLPSAELIASGAVPGVTVNAEKLPTNLQVGLKVAANPFANATRSVATGPTQAELQQKITDIYNWSRPILAFAMYEPMQSASMTGYRRLNGPFDIVRAGLGTVADVATSVSDQATAAQRQVAEAEARARAAAAAAAAAATGRTASPSGVPDYGWAEVREWLRTGRLPMTRNKSAWNQALVIVGRAGGRWFSNLGLSQFGPMDSNFFGGVGGTMFTGPQLLALHGATRQMYDLWVRAGSSATAIPQDVGWASTMSAQYRNHPFIYLQTELNKG